MKIIFGLILCLALSAHAQTKPCNLTVKNSPVVRGLKLGFSKQQFGQIFGRKNVGAFTFLYQADLENMAGFENVSELVGIFDSRDLLDNLVVTYDTTAAQWADAREFARNLSGNLDFPYAYWNFPVEDKSQATANCTDFYIQINSTVNQIFLKTLNPQQQQAAANKKAAEKPQPARTFKP